jgi:hypothetical protein
MGFRKKHNASDRWIAFLQEHADMLVQTGLPPMALRSLGGFRNLFRDGIIRFGDNETRLENLSQTQWICLESFAKVYFDEFDSFVPLDLYPAFREELNKRGSKFRA